MKKGNSQRLKKNKKFAFGNSQFTRQHNISLIAEDPEKNNWQNCLHQWSVITAELVSSLTEKKKWESYVGTTDSNFHGQRRLSLKQQLYCLIMRVFWSKRRVHAIFAVGFVFKSGSDSTRLWWIGLQLEYLVVSNVFVWYKANSSVCWISWELNMFMNVFITFAVRSWLLLLCYWLHPVINPHMMCYYIIVYILESKKVNWRVKVFLSWNNHLWFVK